MPRNTVLIVKPIVTFILANVCSWLQLVETNDGLKILDVDGKTYKFNKNLYLVAFGKVLKGETNLIRV